MTTKDPELLARELHEVSDHGRDSGEYGAMVCDCLRRAERVIGSQWLAIHDFETAAEAIDALCIEFERSRHGWAFILRDVYANLHRWLREAEKLMRDTARTLAERQAGVDQPSDTIPGLITDEMVERAAHKLFEPDGSVGEYTWAEMIAEDPSRADMWRAEARSILEAALTTASDS